MLGLKEIPYKVENGWFSGECNLTGYELEELLGTKLRALYQRRKGRDLFDLYWAMDHQNVDAEKLIHCYKTYMEYSVDKPPTQKQFLVNMEEKLSDSLLKILNERHVSPVLLVTQKEKQGELDDTWKVIKNIEIESDLVSILQCWD